MKRRRVRVGDRVYHRNLGVGDVIRADGTGLAACFEIGVRAFNVTFAERFLCIVRCTP